MSAGESRTRRIERLARIARGLPDEPGVYLFLDAKGRVIYVGKALSLRARVRSYFGSASDASAKVRHTVDSTHDVDFLVARTELEALLLEFNLIQEHRPRYNIVFRDDKRYPYIKVSVGETFPRVTTTRRIEDDGARYFGPYAAVGSMRQTLRILGSVFPLPTCTLQLTEGMSERGCLDYFLGRCVGPCRGDVDPAGYRKIVDDVVLFLEGKKTDLVRDLERGMAQASREQRFEEAARLRDRLFSLRTTVSPQHVTLTAKENADALGMARLGRTAIGVLLEVRGGRVVGRDRLELRCTPQETEGEILRGLVLGFYKSRDSAPPEVLMRKEPEDAELLSTWLRELSPRKVHLRVAQRGEGARLLEMAEHNAEVALAGRAEDGGTRRVDEARELAEALGLPRAPVRIEGVDVSTIQGTDTYASLVVFEKGVPSRGAYRTFRIRDAPRRDDPRSIEEVVRRRARALKAAGGAPDLLLVDGGPTQLAAAERALREQELDVPLIALAKREELVHVPGRREPLRLPEGSAARKLLQRVRDEAHRFALRAHRRRRGGRVTGSVLDEVPGIGPGRRRVLLQTFGSLEELRAASPERIAEVPGIGRELAHSLWTHLGGAEDA